MNDRWERGKPVPGGGCGEQSRVLDYTVTVAGLQYHFSILFFSSILFSFPFGRVRMLQLFFSSSLFSPFRSPQKPPHFLTSIHSNIFLSLITSILNVFSVSASHHHTTTYHIVSTRVLEQIQLPKEEEKNCPRIY